MENITPDYVDFEITQLLLSKGVDIQKYLTIDDENPSNLKSNYSPRESQPWYYTLTITDVVKWLYLKHNIWIVVNVNIVSSWYFELYDLKDIRNAEIDTGDYRETMYNTPEQAYLEAIKYCLTKLI